MLGRRQLLLLGGAAAAAIGGAILLTPREGDHAPAPAGGGTGPGGGELAFPGLAARLAEARRIEIIRPDTTLTVERLGEGWVLPGSDGHPVRPARVRELLVGLTELRLVERRTADPAQLERLGLDDPTRPGSTAVLLRVLDGQGRPIAELVIGRRRTRTQGNLPESLYVRRPAETQTWLAEGRLPAEADPQLWIDRDIANIPAERIARVAVERTGEAPVLLVRREGTEGRPRLGVEMPPGIDPADEVTLDEVQRAFEFLTFLEVRRLAGGAAPGTPLGTGRFTLAEGPTIVVRPSRDAEALWIRLEVEGEGPEAVAWNARWSGWAYQVGIWKEKAFVPRVEDLRPREPVAPGAAAGAPDPDAPAEDNTTPAPSR